MTTYSFPNVGVQAVRFGLQTNTQSWVSPYNQTEQVAELPGARWMATYTFAPYKHSEDAYDEITAFLLKLRGRTNSFYAFDPARTSPKGVGTGTPLVKGGSQTGNQLITDGWTTGQTGILKMGDYFTVNNELKRMTATVNSNGSGEATLVFEPPLRSSPADNAPLDLSSPSCVMRLVDDNQAEWQCDESMFYQISFSAIETFI